MENIQAENFLKPGMQLLRIKNLVTGKFEETIMPFDTAKLGCGDSSIDQEKLDNEFLKNEGDSYTRVQKGTIVSGDAESKIAVDLTFTRTRNKAGGIDVNCIVPCLATLPEMTMGKP